MPILLDAFEKHRTANLTVRAAPSGKRLGEVMGLRWVRWKLERRTLRAEETKTGDLLELSVTRQLVALPERRLEANEGRCGAPQ